MNSKLSCMLAATGIAACGPPPLPPQSDLESGCHVWFDNGSRHGIYAAVSNGSSRLVGAMEVDGPTMGATGEIQYNDSVFAHYADGYLAIEQVSMFINSWHAQLPPHSEIVTLESDGGADPITLHESAACSREDAGLGAAAMFLGILDTARPIRFSSSGPSRTIAPPSRTRLP
jgi:hypothetical protein